MSRTYEFKVGQADSGRRLDQYLVRHLPSSVSRAMIQRVIEDGAVTISEKPVKAHRKLRAGETVTARCDWLPKFPTKLTLKAEPIPLDIVYEDSSLLVVNKPAGLVTHPAPGHWDGTLVNAVLWHLSKQQATSNERRTTNNERRELPRAGIVHRLDKDTSGLLMVAKNPIALSVLTRQLKERTIKREYLALAEGEFPLDEGTVNAAIGRHPKHRKEMSVKHLGGRSAVSHYRVLSRFQQTKHATQPSGNPNTPSSPVSRPLPPFSYTVLTVSLETGRTHQVRVHLSHLGYPLLGDLTYGKRGAEFWRSLGIERQMLHAYRLEFAHPKTAKLITLTAPVPEDMVRWLFGIDLTKISKEKGKSEPRVPKRGTRRKL